MRTVYKFELRRGRTTTLIFTLICTALLLFVMAVYPLFKDMLGDMSTMMSDMGAFSEMFGMDQLDYGSAQDYFATEGGLMVAFCGSILAAFLGGAALGREEGDRTAEWLLTHPISRSRIFFGKLLSMATLLLIMNAVCALFTGLSFPIIGEPLNVKTFLLFYLAQYVMHLEIGCMSLLLSALMKRSAGPIGLGVALVMYFVSLIAAALEELEFLTYITPFTYSDAAAIFTEGSIDMVRMGIGIAVLVVCTIAAHGIWCKKDIAA